MKKITLLLACALIFSGCTMAPKYTKPEMPVNESWPEGEAYKNNEMLNSSEFNLYNFINDKRLYTVIETALDNNRDLRARIANVEAARAQYRIQRADLIPQAYAGGSAGRGKNVSGVESDSYSVEVGLSAYEIDLFGKNRSLKKEKLEQYLASEKTAEAARLSLIAETANVWITYAADREMLKLAQETVESAKKSAEIAQSRHESGVTSVLDVYQANTIYQQAKVDVANYTTRVAQDLNALELLAGGTLDKNLLPESFDGSEKWLGEISAGLSSKVLLRRPDVAAAEHTLKAANANIGAARAAFFPSIKLTSSAGLTSDALYSLFDGGASQLWSFVGNLTVPIFSGGKNKANLEYSKAKYKGYVAEYEKAIQTAFREVSDALARRGTIYEQLAAQKELTEVADKSYNISEERYKLGIGTYLNVLEAQRTYYSSSQSFINTRLTELNNRITLYRVLGGHNEQENQNAQS